MNPSPPARRAARPASLVIEDNRCVLLARASTKEQVLTLGIQLERERQYCAGFKQLAAVREFTDPDTCGKSNFLERPVVRDMLQYLEETGIRQIVCTRIDRAFRSRDNAIVTLDTLHRAGVLVHFCEQDIDPRTPSGKAMFAMLAVFAEFETDIRKERQLDAFDEQRKLGQKSGVNVPYGQRAVPAGRLTRERRPGSDLVPDPEQQQVLGWMLRLRGEGFDDEHIATALNRAGVPSAKAGQMIKYRGVLKPCRGTWSEASVRSVLEFARLADPRLMSRNPDDVEEAVAALRPEDGVMESWSHGVSPPTTPPLHHSTTPASPSHP